MVIKEPNYISTEFEFDGNQDMDKIKICFNKQIEADNSIVLWFTVYGKHKGKDIQLDLDCNECEQGIVKFIYSMIQVITTKLDYKSKGKINEN